jgi:hypothetical protein
MQQKVAIAAALITGPPRVREPIRRNLMTDSTSLTRFTDGSIASRQAALPGPLRDLHRAVLRRFLETGAIIIGMGPGGEAAAGRLMAAGK